VALKLRNVDAMREEFLAVSTPSSDLYGKHLTLQAVQEKYGPLKEDKARVMAYFASIPGAQLDKDPASDMGDMFIVTAPIHAIETKLSTKLSWRQHTLSDSRTSKALRADTDINIPDDISQHLSFVSLNSPINNHTPRGSRGIKQSASTQAVTVSTGNEEVLVQFVPICANGQINVANPPCSNLGDPDQVPIIVASVTEHANSVSNPYLLNTDPTLVVFESANIFCYGTNTYEACDPATLAETNSTCKCSAKVRFLRLRLRLRLRLNAIRYGACFSILFLFRTSYIQ
jgi:Pro-kumamolisin, activation domain